MRGVAHPLERGLRETWSYSQCQYHIYPFCQCLDNHYATSPNGQDGQERKNCSYQGCLFSGPQYRHLGMHGNWKSGAKGVTNAILGTRHALLYQSSFIWTCNYNCEFSQYSFGPQWSSQRSNSYFPTRQFRKNGHSTERGAMVRET